MNPSVHKGALVVYRSFLDRIEGKRKSSFSRESRGKNAKSLEIKVSFEIGHAQELIKRKLFFF